MVVQHNLTAMNANRYLGINNNKLSKSLEKLSSGYAINRAGDNAAGLAVSEKMRSQIAGMTQGVKNAQDGISMVQTFEGALTETDSILQRMKTLADQMANGTYDNEVDRTAAQQEFLQLNDELDQIADTDFNGVVVLNGGVMADGTAADGYGKIDYATSKRGAMELGSIGDMVKLATRDMKVTKDEVVTFTAAVDADGKITWTAPDTAAGTVGKNNKNGGFTYAGIAVSVDTSKVVAGDTITLDLKALTKAKAQTAEVTGYNEEVTDGVISDKAASISIDLADSDIVNESLAKAVNALNGLTIKTTVNGGADAVTTDDGKTSSVNGVNLNEIADDNTADLMELDDGTKLVIDNTGVISHVSKNGTVTQVATIDGWAGTEEGSAAGTITTKVSVTTAKYEPASQGSVKIVEPADVSVSNSNQAATSKLTYQSSVTLQVGARTKDSVNFTFSYQSNAIGDLKADLNCTAKGLGTDKLNLNSQENANYAIDRIDEALNKVSLVRGTFGAIQNRLEHKIDNLNVSIENLTSAESAIRDTDMPTEMMNFTKQQILAQASQSMLAQANQLPQGVLSLLQ